MHNFYPLKKFEKYKKNPLSSNFLPLKRISNLINILPMPTSAENKKFNPL